MGTLEPFPTLPQQAPPADAPNPPSVGVYRRAGRGLVPPLAPPAAGL